MSRFVLKHLSMFGERVETAMVEFSDQLTLVIGPSDTGKSFVVAAIDFMLGAKALPEIPELGGYSTVLMGLSTSGREVTLARSTQGGRLSLYDGLLRDGPLAVAEQTLSANHSAKSDDNVSSFLLEAADLNGRAVQKNQAGATVSLSFRDVARLVVVDETKMQATIKPALSGTYTTASKETSVLRVLLEDEDDSSESNPPPSGQAKATNKAKIEVYDRLLAELEQEMQDVPTPTELDTQLERLAASLAETTRSIEATRLQRDVIARSRAQTQTRLEEAETEINDASELLARFGLLQRQYSSDLSRLEMLGEAGSLLGYFDAGTCAFCGADPDHQHINNACEGDETYLSSSIAAERSRTQALLDDLLETMRELSTRQSDLVNAVPSLSESLDEAKTEIAALEQQMKPVVDDMTETIEARSRVERQQGLVRRHRSLEEARTELTSAAASDTSKVSSKMQHSVLADFSREITRCLEAWGVPEIADVRYDRSEQDIFQGNQFREAHGKGLRSVLHAAFTVGLAQFCLDRDLPHPGFVVLDSPIVTYRPPDYDGDEIEGQVPPEFADAFYTDLAQRFSGQAVVMENVEPPRRLEYQGVDLVAFSKVVDLGRYGFFPVPSDR